MIIAYDFDGTLVENAYPEIGEPRKGDMHPTLIEDVIELQKWGHKVILWTCRTGVHLDQAVEFCKKKGLIFDAVNDDIEEQKEMWSEKLEAWRETGQARKVFAHFYVDDRAVGLCDTKLLFLYGKGKV